MLNILLAFYFYNVEKCLNLKANESKTIQNFERMKIMRKTIFILIFTLVATGFLQARTKQQFTVKINQQKTDAKSKLTIRFVSLIEDSRCPTDVKCIQAGNAKIQIKVSKANGGAARTFELNTNSKPQTVSFSGYQIKLTDLNPKLATNIRIDRNGFMATFAITKVSNSK